MKEDGVCGVGGLFGSEGGDGVGEGGDGTKPLPFLFISRFVLGVRSIQLSDFLFHTHTHTQASIIPMSSVG